MISTSTTPYLPIRVFNDYIHYLFELLLQLLLTSLVKVDIGAGTAFLFSVRDRWIVVIVVVVERRHCTSFALPRFFRFHVFFLVVVEVVYSLFSITFIRLPPTTK